MNHIPLPTTGFRPLFTLIPSIWLAAAGLSDALTYSIGYVFEDNAAKRAEVAAVMNEAVAIYNAQTNIDVNINVSWHPGIPTAQADYNGTLGFGGSINTQVALHEIAHYLGSGTTNEWNNRFGGDDVWDGPAVRRFIKLYDGPGAELRRSGVHYYPYGFNYGNEDNPVARLRLPRLIQAMRFDMGFQDGDGDGMSDEWERYKIGTTSQPATGDIDGDGISNYDEWWNESDPMRACPVRNGRTYLIRSRLSQKYMEAADNTAGANVRQNPLSGTDLQKWTAISVGGGYWKFINLASGKALEVASFSTAPGGNIIVWNDTGGSNQQWRIVQYGGIYSKVFNRNSANLTIDVEGGPNATGNGTNISQYFDDINALNQEWVFDDVTPADPPSNLVAEFKLDGNARDHSGRALHGLATAGVSYGAGRVDAQAAIFNGTNGSIEFPAAVDTNFTLSCWIKTAANAGNGQWYNGMGLIDAEVGGVTKDFGLALVGNKIGFGTGATDFTITSATAVNDNVWHHVAATLDSANGGMKIYIDGVLQASGAGPSGARTAPAKMRLGSIAGVTGFYNGSLDEVRIYNKILDLTEISRLAGVGQTMVASHAFDGDARDASRHGNHGDPSAITYAAGRIGTQAAQFDGTGSFVKIPASVSGDFSIAWWMKTTATGATGQWYAGKAIIDAEVPGVAADWGISLIGNKVGFGIGNADKTILTTSNVNDGVWHHITATRTNSGAMKLYVDGQLQTSDTGPAGPRNAAAGLRLGSTLYGGSHFAGAIDDLKIFNYALPAHHVAAIATPPAAPWTTMDIGTPASDGYAGGPISGALRVTGGGSDIAGTSDQFHFLSTPAPGNQSAITRVEAAPTDLAGSSIPSSRAGLMFRNSTATDSAFVDLSYEHNAGLRFRYRDTAGASVLQHSALPMVPPFWMKLTRTGDTFGAYYATTTGTPAAADWISMGSRNTILTTNPLAGLAVTSRNPAIVALARFSGLTIAPPPSAPGDLWREEYFQTTANSGDAADAADPDHDGIVNLMERALGLDPNAGHTSSGLPVMSQDGSFLILTYHRSLTATDLTYQAVWSENLATWSAEGITDQSISTTATHDIREAKVPITSPEGAFMRLEVK
jgi:Concanavalin A-like lectin/glucanases superfamily/Ricin-type beta-trefoil lectin domain-like/Bacterial TSP3 repeat